MDPLDHQLTEAGAAWRRSRRPPPEVDRMVVRLDRRGARGRWNPGAAIAAIAAALVLAVAFGPQLAGIGSGPTGSDDPSHVWLLTEEGPSASCREALGGGRLVADPRSGLAVADLDGEVTVVRWPLGYTARLEMGRIDLIDPTGRTVAAEGDFVRFAGGSEPSGTWHVCPWDSVVVTEPWASPSPTPQAATPTADPPPSEPPLPEPPGFPGLPAMRVGEITVAGAGTGGCWSVYYGDDLWAADGCGPGSFPLDVAPTTVAAGSNAVVGYEGDARLVVDTFDGRRVELSVRAAPIPSLVGLGEGQQDELPTGGATLELVARFDGGTVLTIMPRDPGDYLVEVHVAVRVGDWTWVGTRFYYRIVIA
jgi:hypothetical protein